MIARQHARVWSDERARIDVARKMYALRFGQVLPHKDITVLRGIEGARLKQTYRLTAEKFGVPWEGRRYDRGDPNATDIPNQAINHAATFVEAAADVAVAAVGAMPPLGFIHEESSNAFTLDIADLFRADITLPLAFATARDAISNRQLNLERELRRRAAAVFRSEKVIPRMIDRVKEILGVDDAGSDA